jgi:glycosyltransferase 2 family protein
MGSAKPWMIWGRIGCVLVTAIALWLVMRKLRLELLLSTFKTMHWGWFAGSVALYGALFVPAAARWHLILRLSRVAMNKFTTLRVTLIGHFFYTVFFGSVGGDSAKAVLYARRYGFPIPSILATAPLDRLLGSVGMIAFTLLSLSVAAESGGLKTVGQLSVSHSALWWAAGALLAVLVAWRFRARTTGSLWGKFVDAFGTTSRRLLAAPRITLLGIFLGLLVQSALCGIIALNLRAVVHEPVPWGKLVWTFPVIVAIGALPISIGGLGTRDGAAMTLLGLYGVSETEAVAASLLTMVAIVFWALAGASLLLLDISNPRGPLTKSAPPAGKTVGRALV